MAPAPAVERKRRRESPRRPLREILNVMRASSGSGAGATIAPTDLDRIHDGSITGFADHALPAARNCALARCRFCGMLIKRALRSATALSHCAIAMSNGGNVR